MRRRLALIATAALLGGCGTAEHPAPDVTTPASPAASRIADVPALGLRLTVPANWRLDRGTAPLASTLSSGQATLAVFRYPRTEPLPRTSKALSEATDQLVAAAKVRDPTFAETGRDTTRVDGHPAVVLRGTETVAGQPRTVRSTHVYGEGAEVVVDAFAPAAQFDRVDRAVFDGVTRSLRIAAMAS